MNSLKQGAKRHSSGKKSILMREAEAPTKLQTYKSRQKNPFQSQKICASSFKSFEAELETS
jgi:hypothetical protein